MRPGLVGNGEAISMGSPDQLPLRGRGSGQLGKGRDN